MTDARTDKRTDERGTGARWGIAAVVAPVAAGALALATGWAVQHDPTAASAPVAAPARDVVRVQPPDKVLIGMSAQAAATRDRVVTLTRTLARLQARTQRIRHKRLPAVSSGSVQVAAPPRVAAAAPAPAAHASTGGS